MLRRDQIAKKMLADLADMEGEKQEAAAKHEALQRSVAKVR